MHSPQSMHRSVIIKAFPFRTRMASVGQRLMQLVQPMHLSLSKRNRVEKLAPRALPPLFARTSVAARERPRSMNLHGHAHSGVPPPLCSAYPFHQCTSSYWAGPCPRRTPASARRPGRWNHPSCMASSMFGMPWPRSASSMRISVGHDLHGPTTPPLCVDDHVDLPFIQGDGHLAHRLGRDPHLLEGLFHGAQRPPPPG